MSFGQLFPSSLPEVLKPIWQEWTQPRTCTKCNVRYDEMNNLGRWLCRAHLGSYNVRRDGQRFAVEHFECCGASEDVYDAHFETFVPRGCYRTDHTISMTVYQERFFLALVPVAFEPFMKQRVPPASIVARVLRPQDEQVPFSYTDASLSMVRTTPAALELRKLFNPFVSHEEDSFYAQQLSFLPYYVVRRTQADRQDAERVNFFASRGPCRHFARASYDYDASVMQ